MATATGFVSARDIHDGANGTNGTDGNDGLSTFLFSVFKRASSAPSTPSGGSYNFSTNSGTAPTGWSTTIPTGTDPLYVSTTTASVSGNTGTDSSLTWSSPVVLAQDGADGANGADGADGADGSDGLSTYLFSIFRRSSTALSTPTGGSYNFSSNSPTAPSGWSTTVPTGSDPLYTSSTLASIQGTTGTDSSLTWSSPTVLAQDGADGTNGANGADGADGLRGTFEATVTNTVVNSSNSDGSSIPDTTGTGATEWTDSGSLSASSGIGLRAAGYVKAQSGNDSILRDFDRLTIYNTSNEWSATRYYDGTNWVLLEEVIDGNLLVTGSVGASAINVDGDITVSATGGSIHSLGKTGVSTSTAGFFLGNESGSTTPVFEVGNDEQYLRWDGEKLSIGGTIVTNGNIRSVDSSVVSFRTYILNGNFNRVDTTVGKDTGSNNPISDTRDPRGQNRYFWTPADDEDGSAGSPYVFEQFLVRPESVNRTLEPLVLNTVQDAITNAVATPESDSDYKVEYQIVGENTKVYANGTTATMFDGGDMYDGQQTETGWEEVQGSIKFSESRYVDFRWTYTGSNTVGSMRFISYANGITEDHSVNISSTGGTVVPLNNTFENIENIQCTPQYSASAIANAANVEVGENYDQATVRAYNGSTETSGMDVFITVRGY